MIKLLFYIIPLMGGIFSLKMCILFPECTATSLLVIGITYVTLLYLYLKKG